MNKSDPAFKCVETRKVFTYFFIAQKCGSQNMKEEFLWKVTINI